MNKEEIRNLVAFCVLMQGGDGILSKAPPYIEEKFKDCMGGRKPLDFKNKAKYDKYLDRWRSFLDE